MEYLLAFCAIALLFMGAWAFLATMRVRQLQGLHADAMVKRKQLEAAVADLTQALREYKDRVDPWKLQAVLMNLSGQERPSQPTLTRTSILYLALMMEEMSETLSAYAQLIGPVAYLPSAPGNLRFIEIGVRGWSMDFRNASIRIRELLAKTPEGWQFELTNDEAVQVFDGVTDVMVVTAGAALALGLPGAEGYLETVGSNISKEDPDTGRIEKMPDGKWIKGPNYKEPDLLRILGGYASVHRNAV